MWLKQCWRTLNCLGQSRQQRLIANISKDSKKLIILCCQNNNLNMANRRNLSTIAITQMTSTNDKEANFLVCSKLIEQAKSKGAEMVFLPEAFDYIATSKEESVKMAESLEGSLMGRYQQLAIENKIWLSLGGFHEKGPSSDPNRIYNSHVILNSEGSITSVYRKCHLFDVMLQTGEKLHESHYVVPGNTIVGPVQTPVGKVGMAICYDLRFPELSTVLTKMGAEILTFPSAFLTATGMAHWEVLLRSRAIENQCYVIAAAQIGSHNPKRASYGHALIVDPWGTVIAQCRNAMDVVVADIDLNYLSKVRSSIPVWDHRRYDIYGDVAETSMSSGKTTSNYALPVVEFDSNAVYPFGHVKLKGSQLFFRTRLSMAFVNIRPVLPGHVLVSPIRPAKRYIDLTPNEISDLFTTVQQVQRVIEKEYNANSATIAIQDGPEAGQSVEHLHIHVMPRKPRDFKHTDLVYEKLQQHDKPGNKKPLRTPEEMATEAAHLASYFYSK